MGWNSRNKCHSVSNGASSFIYVLVNGAKLTHKQVCIDKKDDNKLNECNLQTFKPGKKHGNL